MKHNIRYRWLTIPNKLAGEIRITIDDRTNGIIQSVYDGGKSTSYSIFPFITLQIIRPSEVDDTGKRIRAQWNPNDSLSLTKFNFPIMLRELTGIANDLKIPSMYSYTGRRLDLNPEEAEKVRRVFMIGNTTLELIPVVIEQLDDTRVEGIKMKFNNEQSSVGLTINELDSLITNMQNLDPDALALIMGINALNGVKSDQPNEPLKPYVDIQPKEY